MGQGLRLDFGGVVVLMDVCGTVGLEIVRALRPPRTPGLPTDIYT